NIHVQDKKYRFTVVHDITARKQGEEALRESEEKLSLFLRYCPNPVYIKDEDTRTVVLSHHFEKMLGKPLSQLLGKTSEELWPPELAAGMRADDEKVLKESCIIEREETFDGRRYLSVKFPISVPNRPTILGGYTIDITESKRAEEALRENEKKYRNLVETTHTGFLILDGQGRVMDANAEYVRLSGHRELGEILGRCVIEWTAAHSREKNAVEVARCLRDGAIQNLEIDYAGVDGRITPIEINATVEGTGDDLRIISLCRDISERKELEERIRQVRGDLLFAVSHDLKSPLQALHQSQEMLSALQPGEGLARFQEYSEIWRRNLQRLERMINNLLDSQRGEEGRFPLLLASSNPAEMVKRVVEDSKGYALSSGVTFGLKLQPVPEGSCDEEALARVVENLLINAIKFSPKGGRVEVRLGMKEDALLLEVEDHGLGIPAQEQAHLFQPFQRGSSAHEKKIHGTGLGLYVSRRIVEEHGGSITLASEEGKGTKVTVRLPWNRQAMKEEPR
ncbi:MAG: ATP-binding protein, partial [bacterium]